MAGTINKNDNDSIGNKAIFACLFPNGFLKNPLYGEDGYPNQKPFYVQCGRCQKETSVTLTTNYTNPVTHAISCYGGIEALNHLVHQQRAQDMASTVRGKNKMQLDIMSAFNMKASPQDTALYTWMMLVCIHNTPITKINSADFCNLLCCDSLSYHTFVDTMLLLTMIVEEKIAAEIKGKKGTIMHDGWSKFSRHYVCLLASYMVSTGKRNNNGEVLWEPVMTLLTCTTLPQAADDGDNADEGKFVLFSLIAVIYFEISGKSLFTNDVFPTLF